MGFGTLAIADLVRTSNANILDFGERDLADYIGMYLGAYNKLWRDELDYLVAPVPFADRIKGYGGASGMRMIKSGEHGRSDVSKPSFGSQIGFPKERNELGFQVTRKWLQLHTPMEMMAVMDDAMLADLTQRQKDLKNAIFNPSNRTVNDDLVDGLQLNVKALANNDGFAYPPDPYGNAISGSHNHYLARVSTLAASDIDAVINTVAEHYPTGTVRLLINTAQDSTVRGFNSTGQFLAMQPVTYSLGANAAVALSPALNTGQTNNRQIGYWGNQAAEVWVKPWVPANYMLAVMTGNGSKALGLREDRAGDADLHMEIDDEAYPLRCENMAAEFGFGVNDRLTAAVLYIGGTSYSWSTLV